MTPRHLKQQREFYVSPGILNRSRLIARLPGVEVDAPSRDTINVCAEQERSRYKQMHPSLEFHDQTIVNELQSAPASTRAAKSPVRYAPASRFMALLTQQRARSLGVGASKKEEEDETLIIEQDGNGGGGGGGEDDNPFNPVNELGEDGGEGDSEEESENDSEEEGTTVKEDGNETLASQGGQIDSNSDSSEDSESDSSEESDSDDSDDLDDSDNSDSSDGSDQGGQREENSVPDSIQPFPSKSPSETVSVVQQAPYRTYRNRRVMKVEDYAASEDGLGSQAQESQQSVKSEPEQPEEQIEEVQEHFENTDEQFETPPDRFQKGKELEEESEEESESEREKTPTKSRPSNSPFKTPAGPLNKSKSPAQVSLSTKSSASPASPASPTSVNSPTTATATPEKRASFTPASIQSRKRRRVLLDDDDGFDDGIESEFSRERQAEFFLQSDDEEEDGEEPEENGVQIKGEEHEHTAGAEFDDEFQPIQPRRRGRNPLKGGEKGRARDRFNPAKDRLLLESTEAAKRLAIPLKELFKQLTLMIGHTEYSLQTRLSRLEATESLREIASDAPIIEDATVSDVISKIVHKTQKKTGPKPRVRIPYTDLDDLAIKAFVCDLDPTKRGSYGAYEPFAEKYTHHDASSVKGRWTKTLGPRTREIELLEAKQTYTPELEKQHLDWLHNTYPALFQR